MVCHTLEKNKLKNYSDCKTCDEAKSWSHGYRQELTFDQTVWDTLLKEMPSAGMNMVLNDVGDGVQYESHPEIAVRGAWTPEKLRQELAKMRKLGLEPIPKLNFAATHDAWLGEYSRMVSTKRETVWYCKELIDPPRLLGFLAVAWQPTLVPCLEKHKECIRKVESAIKKYY